MLPLSAFLAALLLTAPESTTAQVFNGRARELAVRPPRIEATVTLDGVLDEPAWRAAAVLTGFSQFTPQDGVAAADSTEVLVWYSPTAIHFGIRAFQPRALVRAALSDRDRIASDDYVQILLGTFNDGRQAVVFAVNPLGVQADGILVERGTLPGGGFTSAIGAREAPDLTPDYVFDSKGRVTDFGYEVEVRIPFKSLKYQAAAVQTWGINIVRKVQYRGHEESWAPAQRAAASFLGQGGTLSGLTDLHRGLVMDVTPEITQRTEGAPAFAPGGAPADWSYRARNPQVGGTVRWGVTNNLTLNGTVKPDFSQVEADAAQISFDPRAALSFPEKRPFFLDGAEQFTVPGALIYTRRIVQPVAAVKLAGKAANSDVALLSAVDAASASTSGRDHPLFNVVRLQRDIGGQSRLGMLFTDREDGSNWNRVLDVDGRLVMRKIYALQFQLAGSATERAGFYRAGPLWDARFNRSGRGFSFRSQFNGVSDDFRTETGFLSRVGQTHASVNPRFAWFGARGAAVEQVGGDVLLDDIWAYRNFFREGDARDKKLHLNLNAQFRGGWTAGASVLFESFGYDPAFYGGRYRIEVPRAGLPSDTLPFTGTPRIPNRDWVFSVGSPQLRFVQFSALYINGQDENFYEWSPAHIAYWNVSATVRASEQFRMTASYIVNDYQRHTNGRRVGRQRDPRLRAEYQMSRSVFVRVIGQYFSDYTDALRDDSRTNLPLLVYNAASRQWVRTAEKTVNALHGEFLFSYKPIPGTVFYAGYGANVTEPEAFAFKTMQRRDDAFFVKASYLWRL